MNTESKPKRQKLWWIKERQNPQTGTYYVACGLLSNTAAKRMEKPIYGSNHMHAYDSEAEYYRDLERFKNAGFTVQKY